LPAGPHRGIPGGWAEGGVGRRELPARGGARSPRRFHGGYPQALSHFRTISRSRLVLAVEPRVCSKASQRRGQVSKIEIASTPGSPGRLHSAHPPATALVTGGEPRQRNCPRACGCRWARARSKPPLLPGLCGGVPGVFRGVSSAWIRGDPPCAAGMGEVHQAGPDTAGYLQGDLLEAQAPALTQVWTGEQ